MWVRNYFVNAYDSSRNLSACVYILFIFSEKSDCERDCLVSIVLYLNVMREPDKRDAERDIGVQVKCLSGKLHFHISKTLVLP